MIKAQTVSSSRDQYLLALANAQFTDYLQNINEILDKQIQEDVFILIFKKYFKESKTHGPHKS